MFSVIHLNFRRVGKTFRDLVHSGNWFVDPSGGPKHCQVYQDFTHMLGEHIFLSFDDKLKLSYH